MECTTINVCVCSMNTVFTCATTNKLFTNQLGLALRQIPRAYLHRLALHQLFLDWLFTSSSPIAGSSPDHYGLSSPASSSPVLFRLALHQLFSYRWLFARPLGAICTSRLFTSSYGGLLNSRACLHYIAIFNRQIFIMLVVDISERTTCNAEYYVHISTYMQNY